MENRTSSVTHLTEYTGKLKRDTSSGFLAGGGDPPYDGGMEARVAVLEEIARNTERLLERMDARMTRIEDRQSRDLKWLVGLGLGATFSILVAMAHGFHWF